MAKKASAACKAPPNPLIQENVCDSLCHIEAFSRFIARAVVLQFESDCELSKDEQSGYQLAMEIINDSIKAVYDELEREMLTKKTPCANGEGEVSHG